ncbi:MAG TPA: hypothetical protein VHA37_04150 [Candidatus Saccharimonadales bacterium]|nr:hypothetical protein [Candidatus Saccharimonadales bacterium]
MPRLFPTLQRGRAACLPAVLIAFGLMLVCAFFYPFAALAQQQCSTASDTTNNCSGTLTSGGGTAIGSVIPAVGSGQGTNNTTTNIANGSVLSGTDRTTISIGNGNTLNIGSGPPGASVTTTTTTGTNSGIGSMYANGGPNTVEVGANNTINISQGSTVSAMGNNARSEAINVFGWGNTIINNGTIFANTSSAIFLQNNPDVITALPGGGNTNLTVPGVPGTFGTVMMNFGTITDVPNPNAAPGTSGIAFAETPQPEATAANANRNVYFANEPGAVVNGSIVLGNGNDTVELFSGSTVNGDVDGGPSPYFINGVRNKDTLILNAQTAPGSLHGTLKDFDILTKTGPFSWEITGPLSSTRFLAVEDVQGTLILSGDTPAPFNGSMTVDPDGTLQFGNGGTTGSLPVDVVNDGLVAFDRSDTMTYSNVISGSGGVNQIGTGTTIFGVPQLLPAPRRSWPAPWRRVASTSSARPLTPSWTAAGRLPCTALTRPSTMAWPMRERCSSEFQMSRLRARR